MNQSILRVDVVAVGIGRGKADTEAVWVAWIDEAHGFDRLWQLGERPLRCEVEKVRQRVGAWLVLKVRIWSKEIGVVVLGRDLANGLLVAPKYPFNKVEDATEIVVFF